MVTGFLKGIWGKPSQKGTGIVGLWGTVTGKVSGITNIIKTPFKIITYIIVIVIGLFAYKRMKK